MLRATCDAATARSAANPWVDADLDDVCPLGLGYVDADGDGHGAGPLGVSCDAVLSDGDCDDADARVHPGALELCDDRQNDCDAAWTDDAGLVTFFPAAGGSSDLTATFAAGNANGPASVSIGEDGTLAICEGTWFAGVDVTANVEIVGHGDAVLDGGSAAGLIHAFGTTDVAVRGLTLRNAATSRSGAGLRAVVRSLEVSDVSISGAISSSTGGGAYLSADSIVLSDVRVEGCGAVNAGGGIYTTASELTAARVQLLGNWVTAGDGGGWAIRAATGTVEDVVATGNLSLVSGGGLSFLQAADLELTRVTASSNSASEGAAFVCSGSTCSFDDSSFTGNTGDQGAGGTLFAGATGSFTDVTVTGNTGDWHVWVAGGTLTTSGLTLGADQTVYADLNAGSSTFTGTDLYCDSATHTCETL
ncbi:MAG: hypothetical protein KC656_28710 [Myxococcales bacterium]|nr:hypothetical protein [Myxococcales bacterium]